MSHLWRQFSHFLSIIASLLIEFLAVIKILEKDEALRAKMEEGDLSHLKISELTDFDEINELAQHLRDELDDLKRSEVERIRKLLKGILRFMTS